MLKNKRQAILVLGMHRSGTSAFAGTLGLLGARLPARQLPSQPDNPKGFFESEKIVHIHDRILAAAGTSWFGLEIIPDEWFRSAPAASFIDELVAAVKEDYDDASLFVVKDPRMCRLMPIWREVASRAGAETCFVIPLRNPLDVARSLEKRSGLPISYGRLLWLGHVLEAERETRGSRRVFESYDNLLRDPYKTSDHISGKLRIAAPSANENGKHGLVSFIDPSMRHHFANESELSATERKPEHGVKLNPWPLEVHLALTTLRNSPNDEAAQRRLDEVYAVYSLAIANAKKSFGKLTHKVLRLDQAHIMTPGGVDEFNLALAAPIAEIIDLQMTIAARDELTERLNRTLVKQDEHIETLNQTIAGRDTQVRGLRDKVNESAASVQALQTTIEHILASTSWRITSSLRAIKRLMVRPDRDPAGYVPHLDRNFMHDAKFKTKEAIKRALGPRLSVSISRLISRFRDRISTELQHKRVGTPLRANDAYQQEYLANAQYSAGGHSPNYGTRILKPPPTERCDVKLVAYYLPQYHPIPENDEWWGKGFTEWRNVARAFPIYVGHDQPRVPGELGYYDLRVPEIMRQQVDLAKLGGISAFCFHFYWFGGKRLLELPVEIFLQNKNLDFQFSLCWANENWTRRWDGAEQEVLISQSHSAEDDIAFIRYLKKYFDDPRYLKIQGKPLLTVYRAEILPDAKATVDRWRAEAVRMGFPGIYLIATNSFRFTDYQKFGFDALTEFPPHSISAPGERNVVVLHPDYRGNIFSYPGILEKVRAATAPPGRVLPGVMPGWDNTPRRLLRGDIFHGSTPILFYEWLTHSIGRARENDQDERIVFINAWNEWAEGAHLEPDRKTGYSGLAACAAAISDSVATDPRVADLFEQQRKNFRKTHRRAVAIHLYYEDLAYWFSQKVLDFGEVDVFVTVARTINWETANTVKDCFPSAYILEVENRGRDIRPFLAMYQRFIDGDYDFVCKLHTKKSPFVSKQVGNKWRETLVEQLLGDAAKEALEIYGSDPSVGILAPFGSLETLSRPSTGSTFEKHLILLDNRLNCEIDFSESFVAGSMFWFRPSALSKIYEIFLQGLDFEPELGQLDGTLAHAMERIFCIAAKKNGMSTREFGDDPVVRPWQHPHIHVGPTKISIKNEESALQPFATVDALLNADLDGRCRIMDSSIRRASDLSPQWPPEAGGRYRPEWWRADPEISFGSINLFRVKDAYYWPRFGVVATSQGVILQSSWSEASYLLSSPSELPHISKEKSLILRLPENIPRLDKLIVTMPWGAIHNYGHFVLDALPGFFAARSIDLPNGYVFGFPRLSSWQRRHLELAGNLSPCELEQELYKVSDLVFTSCMDHFLHEPNFIYRTISETEKARATKKPNGRQKIYLSRKGNAKRRFLSEKKLEHRLANAGFRIVAPEQLTVDEQISLFDAADVIIGCSGAAFANVLYCRPGTKIVEIQPSIGQGIWIRNICATMGLAWLAYFCIATPGSNPPIAGGKERQDMDMSFDTDFDDLINFLQKHDIDIGSSV